MHNGGIYWWRHQNNLCELVSSLYNHQCWYHHEKTHAKAKSAWFCKVNHSCNIQWVCLFMIFCAKNAFRRHKTCLQRKIESQIESFLGKGHNLILTVRYRHDLIFTSADLIFQWLATGFMHAHCQIQIKDQTKRKCTKN